MKDILQSRKFWSVLITLILVIVLAFFPGFPDIGEAATEIAFITAAYIFGTAIDPRTEWKSKLLGIFRSRKFYAALAGLIVIFIKQYMPDLEISEEQITAVIITLSTFIIGSGLEDKIQTGMSTQDKARANSQ